jgi:hypothetical protein
MRSFQMALSCDPEDVARSFSREPAAFADMFALLAIHGCGDMFTRVLAEHVACMSAGHRGRSRELALLIADACGEAE